MQTFEVQKVVIRMRRAILAPQASVGTRLMVLFSQFEIREGIP